MVCLGIFVDSLDISINKSVSILSHYDFVALNSVSFFYILKTSQLATQRKHQTISVKISTQLSTVLRK